MKRPKLWFFPYHRACMSVWEMVDKLPALIIKRERSKYERQPGDIIVNWGSYGCPYPGALNSNEAVEKASSKLKTFKVLKDAGVPIPAYTTRQEKAQEWAAKGMVLGRDLDRGMGGHGITVYEKDSVVGHHKFYTRYMRKDRELRVHVFQGKIIFEQEKKKKNGANADKHIGSHGRGWCFAFHHLQEQPVPAPVRQVAQDAVRALGLDFGAVDVVWNERTGVATVLEVNTAPGIENTSLAAYVKAFEGLLA